MNSARAGVRDLPATTQAVKDTGKAGGVNWAFGFTLRGIPLALAPRLLGSKRGYEFVTRARVAIWAFRTVEQNHFLGTSISYSKFVVQRMIVPGGKFVSKPFPQPKRALFVKIALGGTFRELITYFSPNTESTWKSFVPLFQNGLISFSDTSCVRFVTPVVRAHSCFTPSNCLRFQTIPVIGNTPRSSELGWTRK